VSTAFADTRANHRGSQCISLIGAVKYWPFSEFDAMKEKHNIDRRNFLKTVGAAGLGPVLVPTKSISQEKTQKTRFTPVPKRKLGKTGVNIPCLTLGTATSNFVQNQIVLRNSLLWGVTCWDTATNYAGGNSELGLGKYLSKNPKARKELFIISKPPDIKTPMPDAADIEEHLQTSLKRMNTGYIDLYLGVHNILGPAQLTNELKEWAQSAKKRKLIRLFGFSTHMNMAQCLAAAAKLNWIDAVMTVYNFRLMQDVKMQASVKACHKAGIGLIAIKTLAAGPGARWAGQEVKVETEQDKKLTGHFTKLGFTVEQAKIKVALQNKCFSSVCVGMGNVSVLKSNVAAVLDKTTLSQENMEVFREYAAATCSVYCAGCSDICNAAIPETPYVSDIMRYLMYYNSYGDIDRARELFAQIPNSVRSKLLSTDYSVAEARCPQRLRIGELITEAVNKLA
jgi:predicted aldo/keto reductase-like oxidoreductase